MALFHLFSNKKVANSDVNMIPVEIHDEQEVNNEKEDPVEAPKEDEGKKNLITITWGTGMPIDVIFNFIHKNFEEEGFQDALVNSDIAYRDIKENIIRNDLEMLFKRIILCYRGKIREIDVELDNARKAYALAAASKLQALRDIYDEHLNEIDVMLSQFEADDPKMTTMIESYRRGFLKGITSRAISFINNDQN